MADSFYASQDLLMEEGQEPDLETLFLDAYNTKTYFCLQFEDQEDYDRFCEDLGERISQIAQNSGLPGYRWSSCMVQEYRVIRVDVSEYE